MFMMLLVAVVASTTALAWQQDQVTWSAPWSWIGPTENAKFGLCVSAGGDLNNDGIDDMVFAAPYDSTGGVALGTIHVVFGSSSGWQPELPIITSSDASFQGEAEGDHPGGDEDAGSKGLAIVPSVNGDAYDDIVVAAPKSMLSGSTDFGAVYLIFGKPTAQWEHDVPLYMADASLYGEAIMGSVSVASAGDVNGDEKNDILIGVSGRTGVSNGKTYLLLGKNSWPGGGGEAAPITDAAEASFVGEQPLSQAGASVSGVADLNGDGRDEILIGAPKYSPDIEHLFAGKAYLILGRASGWSLNESLANADYSIVGEVESGLVGTCVSGAGDIDDDDKGDLLVSSSNPQESGRIYLFLGSSVAAASAVIPASGADTQILGADFSTGDAMAPLGDVNGDNYDDFAIGAALFDNGVGKAYAVFGSENWPATLDIEQSEGGWRGVSGKFWAGCSVAGGDVDGDGRHDMVIGAGADPFAGYDAGAVYVIPSNYSGDIIAPAAVTEFQAQVDLVDSTAALTWNAVLVDQTGNPEQVLFYRAIRYAYDRPSGNQPPETTLLGQLPAVLPPSHSATDSEWVPWNENFSHYTFYHILAVDTRGNVSALSPSFSVFQYLNNIP
jgi:glycosylphosphatidylinositol phospholipase D